MKQKKNSKIGLGSGLSSLLGTEVEKKSDNFKMTLKGFPKDLQKDLKIFWKPFLNEFHNDFPTTLF